MAAIGTHLRQSNYLEKSEYKPYELSSPLLTHLANNVTQPRQNLRFNVEASNSIVDWYYSFVEIEFVVQQLANGTTYPLTNRDSPAVQIAPCCGVQSFIDKFTFKSNQKTLYQTESDIAYPLYVKNLVLFTDTYARTTAKKYFWHLDKSAAIDNDNSGFRERRDNILGGNVVNVELPLNFFSFFEELEDKILPPSDWELSFDLQPDNYILYRDGGTPARDGSPLVPAIPAVPQGRVVFMKFRLWCRILTFNGLGDQLWLKQYSKPSAWTYLKEHLYRNGPLTVTSGTCIISGVERARHLFVWFLDVNKENDQLQNRFIFDFCRLSTLQLSVSDRFYPEIQYEMSEKMRIYRDLLEYTYRNHNVDVAPQFSPYQWRHLFPIYYFDLTKRKVEITDSSEQIAIRYILSSSPGIHYYVYCLVLGEREVKVEKMGNDVRIS